MHYSLRRISIGLMVLMIAGCGASTAPRKQSRVEPASKDGYDFRKEGKVPPPAGGQARPETDVEEIAIDDSTALEVSEADAPPDTAAQAPAGATVDGFRIQLFASADRDVAQNARDVAVTRLGLPVYLDLEGGVYKVRAGDFGTRVDADATLPSVRSPFYPDAWIVAARIKAARP
jgi:hypothetical protein